MALRVLLATLLAALAAPWTALLAVVVHVAIVELVFVSGPTSIWMNVGLLSPFALFLAYGATWTVGIPAHFVLWLAGRSGVVSYAVAGALLGALSAVAVFGLDVLADWRAVAYLMSYAMPAGSVVAIAFRAIFEFFLEPGRAIR